MGPTIYLVASHHLSWADKIEFKSPGLEQKLQSRYPYENEAVNILRISRTFTKTHTIRMNSALQITQNVE